MAVLGQGEEVAVKPSKVECLRGEGARLLEARFDGASKNRYPLSARGIHEAEIAAVFCTLLETAKLCGVGPSTYLREAALADARGDGLVPYDLVASVATA